MSNSSIDKDLQEVYDDQYKENISAWRSISAKYKSLNIIDVTKGHKFKKVLECGAGEGAILEEISKYSNFEELFGIEISKSGIQEIKKRNIKKLIELKKFDGYKIPYDDNEFDLVICSHVIEHVEHPRLLLREIKRVSKNQVFEVPLDYSIEVDKKLKYFLDYGHINIYTPSLFKFLIKSEGFNIISQKLSRSSKEVIEYHWFKMLNKPKNLINSFMVRFYPLFFSLKKIIQGGKYHKENEFNAYTCFCDNEGKISIF